VTKVTAKCTCWTCGNTFGFTASRQNRAAAESFKEWAEDNITECSVCEAARKAKEREAENAAAAEEAAKVGWPQLTGSAKQIAWATTIRQGILSKLTADIKPESAALLAKCIEVLVSGKTDASWWIDRRESILIRGELNRIAAEIAANPEPEAAQEAVQHPVKEAEKETVTIAEPQDRKHDGIVDIQVTDQSVTVKYRKDDNFRDLVKDLGYTWDASTFSWSMQIGARTGTAKERAAELGNKLLNAGFAIRIQDANTLKDAINGNYKPMTHRWVAMLRDQFFITWAKSDDLYKTARSLPTAKYHAPGVLVRETEYEAVADFAQAYDFKLTAGAQELMDKMRASSATVLPGAAKEPQYNENAPQSILGSSREIISDLKD